jgi:hypothetical protein
MISSITNDRHRQLLFYPTASSFSINNRRMEYPEKFPDFG